MGDPFYVVADKTTSKGKRTFQYVCFGKQIETYINHKYLLAAFMMIKDSCDSYACDIKFINGDKFEYEVKKAFGQKWKDHVQDVSKEYEEYAVEELEPNTNFASVIRLYEAISKIREAQRDKTLSEEHQKTLQIKYGLLKYIADGVEPKKYPFRRDLQTTCYNCKNAVIGVSYFGEDKYCKVEECDYQPK